MNLLNRSWIWMIASWTILVVIPWSFYFVPSGLLEYFSPISDVVALALALYFSVVGWLIGEPLFRPGDWGMWGPAVQGGWVLLFICHGILASVLGFLTAWVLRDRDEPKG